MMDQLSIRTFLGPVALTVLAVLFLVRGQQELAVIFLLAALLLAHAMALSNRARQTVLRSQAAVGAGGAAVVRVALLTPILLLVLTPAGWISRLFGGRGSWDRTGPTAWRAKGGRGRDRTTRQWSEERRWVAPQSLARRRVVVSTVVTVLLVEAVLIGGIAIIRERRSPEARLVGTTAAGTGSSAALRDLPWAPEALRETGAVSNQIVFTPFVGLSIRDFHSRYVNVDNRVRKSYVAPIQPGQKPLDVWFFGGSTMFGFDLQRDEHTIPSEVVRLAQADGIPIRARNYGSTGYVNYQETLLLALLLGGGQKPDLVVFYDGVNDESLGFLNAIGGFDPAGEPSYIGSFEARQALAIRHLSEGATPGVRNDLPPSPLQPVDANPLTARSLTSDIVGVYDQGVQLSRMLGQRYGVPVTHFWQPEIYSRRPLDPGERALFPGLGLDQYRYETIAALLREVRASLPAGVVDISNSLDSVHGPVFSDSAHINEVGGHAVAEAMYGHLKSQLQQLAAAR
jgi:hypothetical protein